MSRTQAKAVLLCVAGALTWALAAGCNAMFGIDELSYTRTEQGAGGAVGPGQSCENDQQDGNETDVDCGGGCPPCSNGSSCERAADCASGRCVDATCEPCRDEQDCAVFPGTRCNEQAEICVGSKILGDPCQGPTECASGFCPADDAVCCDTPCSLTCEACVQRKTGVADGICDFVDVAIASDPDGECPATDVAGCGSNGAGCSGTSTSCVFWEAGAVCALASCVDGTAQGDGLCDGLGTCVAGVVSSCGAYTCDATTCRTSCSDQSHCAASWYCDGNGACQPKKGTGQSCSSDVECLSGVCTNGLCG